MNMYKSHVHVHVNVQMHMQMYINFCREGEIDRANQQT